MSSSYCLLNNPDDKAIDIALITEHKLLPRSQSFLLSINENFFSYSTFDNSVDKYGHLRCGKAGTAILIRKRISQISNIDNDRIVGIEIRNNHHIPLYILCMYMPSESDVNWYNETLCDVQALFSHYCNVGTVLITGDLNAQLVTDSRLSQNPKSKLLSLFVNRNGLVPAHSLFGCNAYTYVPTRSILDYVLVERAASHIITDYSVAKPEEVLTFDHLYFSIKFWQ